MPPAPKSPSSAAKKAAGAPKAKGAVRAKSGCYTCRIRRKKCDEQPNAQGQCQTCVRLRLECLGFGAKRPEWLRESRNVIELREKIKTFLASQGMIKGHSGSGPRTAEHEPQILRLADEGFDPQIHQQQPPTPLLALSNDPNRTLLPPFNNLSAVRDTQWAIPGPGPLPYPVNQPSPPQHMLRPPTPGSHYYPSPGTHEAVLPHSFTPQPLSNSLVPPPSFAPYRPPLPESQNYSSSEPWRWSSFSKWYHPPSFSDDEGAYEESQLDPALFSDVTNASGGIVVSYARDSPQPNLDPSPFIDDLVNHYMHTVVNIQYLMANKSETARMIFNTVQQNPVARDAVRLLASIHQHKHRTRSAEDRALERVEHQASGLYQDLVHHLFGHDCPPSPSQALTSHAVRRYSTEDAMAAILVISSILFDGGMGDWRLWLRVAYVYVDSILSQFRNPADALSHVTDEKMSFIIKTTLWFDVIASVTTQEPPHYLQVIHEVFSPQTATIDGFLPNTINMLDVMGCDNNTFWAMAQTSALSCWKQSRIERGALSVPELVMRGGEIEQALTHTYVPSATPGEGAEEDMCRYTTAAIFRGSTLAWLHSIISGDRPHVPEVAAAVQETIQLLQRIPNATPHEQRLERSIVRSTVFSIFICGVFSSKRTDRELLMNHMKRQSSDHVGNCTAISKLLSGIWDRYEREGKSATVKWREPLKASSILLV